MTAGLFIRNDSGNIQIDENYMNFCFKQKINVDWPASGSGFMTKTVTFTGSESAVCAIKMSRLGSSNLNMPTAVILKATRSGTTWTVTIGGNNNSSTAGGDAVATIYVFDVNLTNSERCGLMVWNADGDVVYHTSNRPLKLVDWSSSMAPNLALIQILIGIDVLRGPVNPSTGQPDITFQREGNIITTAGVVANPVTSGVRAAPAGTGIFPPVYALVDVRNL